MTREGFETYKLYLALQRHFSTSYDFFKYNGKVNVSIEAYQKRNDMFSFEKLTKIVIKDDLIDFFVAHFLENPKMWIRNMSKAKLEQHRAKIKNFSTKFREDLEYLSNFNLGKLIKCENDIPEIHKLVMSDKISLETVIAMDKFYPFIDKQAEECKVPFVWPDYLQKLVKYRPFFSITVTEFHKDIMRDVLLNK